MRDSVVPVQQSLPETRTQQCVCDAWNFVRRTVERAKEGPSRLPVRVVEHDAEVWSIVQLVGGVMAKNAELVARVERLERGPWSRLKAWWRS